MMRPVFSFVCGMSVMLAQDLFLSLWHVRYPKSGHYMVNYHNI